MRRLWSLSEDEADGELFLGTSGRMRNKVIPEVWVVKLVGQSELSGRHPRQEGTLAASSCSLPVPLITIRLSLVLPVCKSSPATSKPAHRLVDYPLVLGSSAYLLRAVIGYGELVRLPSAYHLLIVRLQGQNASNLGGPPPGGDGKDEKDKKVSRSLTKA